MFLGMYMPRLPLCWQKDINWPHLSTTKVQKSKAGETNQLRPVKEVWPLSCKTNKNKTQQTKTDTPKPFHALFG